MIQRPPVTVLVPVYEGGAFVEETLRAICAQTHRRLAVLVSVDRSDDDSLAVCRRFAATDHRFRVVAQPTRLGWRGNTNWLLERIETELFCLVPHDDLPAPTYLERLFAALEAQPRAVCAYCDLRAFGDNEGVLDEDGISGGLLSRLVAYLVGHHLAIAYRGLTRAAAARAAGPIPSNPWHDLAADTVWVFSLLIQGDLVRVPEPLYDKRYRRGKGGQTGWRGWSRERILAAWTAHCGELGAIAARLPLSAAERRVLWEALVFRLLWMRRLTGPFPDFAELNESERAEQLAALSRSSLCPG